MYWGWGGYYQITAYCDEYENFRDDPYDSDQYVERRDSTAYPVRNTSAKNQVESKRQPNAPVPGRNY